MLHHTCAHGNCVFRAILLNFVLQFTENLDKEWNKKRRE